MPRVDRSAFVRDVQRLAAQGRDNGEIAKALGIERNAMLRRLTRYGFRYHQPPGQWVPREETEECAPCP